MEFTQTQLANITLGSNIGIGEYWEHETHAKPGNYRVYNVQRATGSEETALLYIHEDEVRDINELLPTLDIDTFCGVDGGTYGIVTQVDYDEDYVEWFDRDRENQEGTDGYIAHTNYGDGQFSVYMNKDHSVFLLDDEDIYLESLLANRNIDYNNDLEAMDWFSVNDDGIKVVYRIPTERESITLNRPVDANVRKIDHIVDALVDVAQLTRINEVVNELEDEPTQEQ